jgi:hypothetical protein
MSQIERETITNEKCVFRAKKNSLEWCSCTMWHRNYSGRQRSSCFLNLFQSGFCITQDYNVPRPVQICPDCNPAAINNLVATDQALALRL